MEEAPAMAMRRSSDKAAPLPPQTGGGSRRRRSTTSSSSAWPAFPAETNRGAAAGSGLGLGCGKQSPVSKIGVTSCRSPLFQSTSAGFTACGSVPGSGAAAGAGARKISSSDSSARVSGCGVKSSGVVRNKAFCCDSCRPSAAAAALHSHQGNESQSRKGGRGSSRIEYDDVFGGPPKYLTSVCDDLRKVSIPDYDDIFQGSSSNRRSASSVLPPQSAKTKSSRAAELPIFDPPEHDSEAFQNPPVDEPKSPAAAATDGDVVYDDVFGGPLTGPRTKLLKDLLRCSGFAEAKRKAAPKSKASTQSDSSPVSSLHSICRESHGNPIYEYESEVYGDGKHFNSPRKSSMESATDKSPHQAYVELESNRKPAVTSVSASSSPFTEHFDDSTVQSYSTRASRSANDLADYGKVFRKAEVEIACSSSSESAETEYLRKPVAKLAFGEIRKQRSGKPRRPSRVRASKRNANPVNPTNSFSNGGKLFGGDEEQACDSSQTEREVDLEVEMQRDRKTEADQKEPKQVSFITVSSVELTTKPSFLPPARPAPSKNMDILSEKEMSELLETEAFMEYSIKDLDGLVAEEYLVSHESISESSPSTSSVSNTLKSSLSGRSFEDEDSDHCYAKDIFSPEGEASEVEKAADSAFQVQQQNEDECGLESVRSHEKGGAEADITNPNEIKSNLEEPISSSSSSFREQTSKSNGSGDLSSLCEFVEIAGETSERRRFRWERHQRASERVAKVLAEKNSRDSELERKEAEKQRVAELLDDVIKRWAAGKRGNLRALLSTLQYILWPECGWQPVSLIDIIEPVCVRKAYRKATLCVHPDKLQQKNASAEHRFIASNVFDLLQEAWTSFNYEQNF